jgi:hypothetical protein
MSVRFGVASHGHPRDRRRPASSSFAEAKDALTSAIASTPAFPVQGVNRLASAWRLGICWCAAGSLQVAERALVSHDSALHLSEGRSNVVILWHRVRRGLVLPEPAATVRGAVGAPSGRMGRGRGGGQGTRQAGCGRCRFMAGVRGSAGCGGRARRPRPCVHRMRARRRRRWDRCARRCRRAGPGSRGGGPRPARSG